MVPYKRLWACPIHETLKCKAGAKIRNLYYKKCYCESWQLSLEKAVRSYVQRNVTTSPTQQTSLVASLKGFHNTGQLKLQIYHFDKKEWVFTWLWKYTSAGSNFGICMSIRNRRLRCWKKKTDGNVQLSACLHRASTVQIGLSSENVLPAAQLQLNIILEQHKLYT